MYAPKHFKYSEFDSPDQKNSGLQMNQYFMMRLDLARNYANVPFVIASGFRTKEYNQKLYDERKQNNSPYFVSKESEHTKGLAADVVLNDNNRFEVLKNAAKAGFTVFGIAKGFVHLALNSKSPRVYFYDIKDEQEKEKHINTIASHYQKVDEKELEKKIKNINPQGINNATVGITIAIIILALLYGK